jgi:hypothetical protein
VSGHQPRWRVSRHPVCALAALRLTFSPPRTCVSSWLSSWLVRRGQQTTQGRGWLVPAWHASLPAPPSVWSPCGCAMSETDWPGRVPRKPAEYEEVRHHVVGAHKVGCFSGADHAPPDCAGPDVSGVREVKQAVPAAEREAPNHERELGVRQDDDSCPLRLGRNSTDSLVRRPAPWQLCHASLRPVPGKRGSEPAACGGSLLTPPDCVVFRGTPGLLLEVQQQWRSPCRASRSRRRRRAARRG